MNEIEINKRFEILIEQRNNALNSIVLLNGELAVANARIKELEGHLKTQPYVEEK
jgi:hypothetical protein